MLLWCVQSIYFGEIFGSIILLLIINKCIKLSVVEHNDWKFNNKYYSKCDVIKGIMPVSIPDFSAISNTAFSCSYTLHLFWWTSSSVWKSSCSIAYERPWKGHTKA